LIGQIADHLALAGQAKEASNYLELAGSQAAALFANSEAIRYYSRAVDMCPPADTAVLFRILQQREQVYDLTGQRQAQLVDIQTMQELAESLGDWYQAESALRQANYADVSGDYQAAIKNSQYAVDYAQGTGDSLLQAKANLQLAVAMQHIADYVSAQFHFDQTIQLSHSAISTSPLLRIIEADSLRGLATIAQNMGEFSKARGFLQHAQAIYHEVGDYRGAARALNVLGIVAAESGDLPTARANFTDALGVFRQIGDPYHENRMILNLSNVATIQGDYSLAQEELKKALIKTQEIGDLQGRGAVLLALGNVYYELGDYNSSRDYYAQSLEIAGHTGSPNDKLLGLNIAFAEHGLGDFTSAEAHLMEALKICRDINEPISEAYDLQELGEVMLDLGRLDEAEETFQRVIPIRREIEQEHLNLLPLSGLAWIEVQRGHVSAVQEYMEAALPILAAEEAKGDPGTSLLAYLRLWQALVANQDPRAAKIISTAHHYLLDRAAHISDENLRRGFIQDIPWHRQIIEAYQALESMGQPDD
jgi:tetratricopeptide (TPR) repeat protein